MHKFFKKNIHITVFISLLLALYQCVDISVSAADVGNKESKVSDLAPVLRTSPMAAVSVDEENRVTIGTDPEAVSEAAYGFRETAGFIYLVEFIESVLLSFGDNVTQNTLQELVSGEIESYWGRADFNGAHITVRRAGSSYFLSNDQGDKSFLVEFFLETPMGGSLRVVRRVYPLNSKDLPVPEVSGKGQRGTPSPGVSGKKGDTAGIRTITGRPDKVIAEMHERGVNDNTVFVDFDETLIKESSPVMWGLMQVKTAFFQKNYKTAVKLFFAAIKKRWSYGRKGDLRSTLRLYEGTPMALVDFLAKGLSLNTDLLDILDKIKEQKGLEEVHVVVLSRNLSNLIRRFLALEDVREELKRRGIVIDFIIANKIIETDKRLSRTMVNSKNIVDSTTKAQYIPEGNLFIVDYSELSTLVDRRFSISPLISRKFIIVRKKKTKKDSTEKASLPESSDISMAEKHNINYVRATARRDRTMTPAILLEELFTAEIFIDNAMTVNELYKTVKHLYSKASLRKAIKFLHAAGIILVTGRGRKYYLPNWITRERMEEIIDRNPELRGLNSKWSHVNAVRIRTEDIKRVNKMASGEDEIKQSVELMTSGMIAALSSAAYSIHKKGEKIVIGVETGWIPEIQMPYIQGVFNELGRFYKKAGMGDIIIRYGEGKDLAERITRDISEKEISNANVIVLGSIEALRKEEFEGFRSEGDPEEWSFFMEIAVPDYFPENSYIRIPEMIKKALDLWRGYKIPAETKSLIIEQTGKRIFRFIIPSAEPLEYDLLRQLYETQRDIIESA